jgi:RNA polymerase sigma-70 factor (ECF subfamily)
LASLPAPDDRIAAAARGDRAAAESLCRELLPRVRNLVRYLVRGDSLVDDVAQEALIAVMRGLHTYRGEGRFQSWADRVVARTTFASLRRLRGRPEEQSREMPDAPAAGMTGEEYVLRRQVARHLDELPAEQRESLVLHFTAGMTIPEIAELTGAPQETVRSRIRLGKAALRLALGGLDGDA